MRLNLHEEIRRNKIKSFFIVFLFVAFLVLLGYVFGLVWGNPYTGIGLALIASVLYSIIMYAAGSSAVLSMTGARPVTKQEYPHLYHTVEGIALAAGVPPPKAYVIDDSALNAFATGTRPEKAAITVTTGLLKKLNRAELEGVIAHEMSHIKNYDIRVMLLAAVLVGAVTLLSDFLLRSFLFGGARRRDDNQTGAILIVIGLVLAILSPFIAQMIKLAISRRREYLADATGAKLTRYPKGLADALRKISGDPDPLVDHANKATAHLFISTPFRKRHGISQLFATHPPIDERIRRLDSM